MLSASSRPRVSKALVAKGVVFVACAAALLTFPDWAPNPYILSAGIVVLSYAVLSTSWNFVGGFTGYISLGHAAYFGLGAYGTALLVTELGLPSFVAWFVAGLGVAVLAVPIGFAALRVRGASFVIVSIALVLILLLVFQSWSGLTGGSNGLVVPRPFPDLLRPEHHRTFFYLFAGLLAVTLLAWWLIDRSRFGMGLKAIREDEDKAEALGVPTYAYKLVVFVVSAFFTALGGRHVRPLVRRPGPGLPVLDPHRLVHGADGAARRCPSAVRAAARRGHRRQRPRVLQARVRRHAVPPGRHRACSSPSSCCSCPTASSRPARGSSSGSGLSAARSAR